MKAARRLPLYSSSERSHNLIPKLQLSATLMRSQTKMVITKDLPEVETTRCLTDEEKRCQRGLCAFELS